MTETESVGTALPKEQARCRKLLGIYKQIGPNGAFGALMIEHALRRADEAVISGDPVAILQAYQELKEFEE